MHHNLCIFVNLIFQWLKKFTRKIEDLGAFDGKEANHVLVNEYATGQGIMVNILFVLLVKFFVDFNKRVLI